jgi:hypothetical protein
MSDIFKGILIDYKFYIIYVRTIVVSKNSKKSKSSNCVFINKKMYLLLIVK